MSRLLKLVSYIQDPGKWCRCVKKKILAKKKNIFSEKYHFPGRGPGSDFQPREIFLPQQKKIRARGIGSPTNIPASCGSGDPERDPDSDPTIPNFFFLQPKIFAVAVEENSDTIPTFPPLDSFF